jgi:hypothetical protein
MERDNPLIDRLSADLRPMRPQRPGAGWVLLALGILATVLVVHAVFGLQPAAALGSAEGWPWFGELLLGVLGLACAWAVIRMASPQYPGRPAAWWVVAAAVMPLAALLLAAVPGTAVHAPDGAWNHWGCALWGMLSGTLVATVLTYWLRRGAPVSPGRAGLYTGLAAGALGSAIFGLACPAHGFHHWATWHFVPVLACGALGRMLLPRFLRW